MNDETKNNNNFDTSVAKEAAKLRKDRSAWNPVLAIETIRNTMNELMADIFYQTGKAPFEVHWQPHIDMYADERDLHIEVSLAGIPKENIQIHASTSLIIIQGKKEEIEKQSKYFIREINQGVFSRSIPLPFKVVPDLVRARFCDGLLIISVPIKEEEPAKSIKIEIE